MIEIPNLVEALDRAAEKRIKAWPHPNNRASEAGHPCVRFLVLSRLEPDKKVLHDVNLQRIFDLGNVFEKAVFQELQEAGVNVVEQQRPFEWKKFQLTGHIDGKIQVGITIGDKLIPIEIKSCSPNSFTEVEGKKPIDLINSRKSWLRKYPAQILLYMLMDGSEAGIIIFKNKLNGKYYQMNFQLDDTALEYTESILKKLEVVNDYVARREIPPLEPCDECARCGFEKTICFPGKDYGAGYDFSTDPEIEKKLLRWEELQPLAKEYEELEKEIKEKFKGKTAVVGDFIIESKELVRKTYEIPDEVKKVCEKQMTYWVTKIKRLGE